MIMDEKEPMRHARFSIPVALFRDRFLFAIGGMTNKTTSTEVCEIYDVNTN
jgi:hypothetical protein